MNILLIINLFQEKHLIICQKIKDKKRKLFDAAKQRADNLDKINHYPTEINPAGNAGSESTATTHSNAKTTIKGSKNKRPGRVGDKKENQESNNSSTSKKQSNWRQQHQEFIRTIRAARGAAVSDDNDTSADTGALPAGVVECPTCGRRFSNKAADRHITWCAENVRKQQQKKQEQIHNGNSKNLEALERMKNRTKVSVKAYAMKEIFCFKEPNSAIFCLSLSSSMQYRCLEKFFDRFPQKRKRIIFIIFK